MSQKKITINTRKRWINTRLVRDIKTGLLLEKEGYWYDGPIAQAGVASTGMDAFRFYASDNSTAIAAQDVDPTTLAVDTVYVLRVRIYNSGAKNEDSLAYQLQYENSTQATGVNNVTGASSHVRTADATGLTDGSAVSASTLTGAPGGSFINGEQVEDGTPAALVITAGDYTEMHYAFTIQSGDVNNGDNINLSVSAPDAGAVTPSITVLEANPTTVTLTNDSLTLSDGTLTVSQSQATVVTLSADSFTLSDGTLTVRAEQETRVTLTPDSLTLSDGTLTVRPEQETRVSLAQDSFTLSDGTLGVRAEQETRITLGTDSLTLSDGSLTVQQAAPTVVTLAPDSLTLSDGTLGVRAEQETRITMGEAVYYADFNGVSGDYISTPDSATNSITGDIDIRVKVAPDDWTPDATSNTFIAKWDSFDSSYVLQSITGGTGALRIFLSGDGTEVRFATSSLYPSSVFSNGEAGWVRVTVDISTMLANFYTSSDNGQTWDLLGLADRTFSGALTGGAIYDSGASVTIGSYNAGASDRCAGKIYEAYVYDGIDGTLAVDFNASDNPNNNATHVSDGVGETWTWTDINSVEDATQSTVTALTITEGTLSIRAEQESRLTLVPDSLTLSDGTLTVRAENESRIALGADSFTVSDGTLTVAQSVAAAPTPRSARGGGGGRFVSPLKQDWKKKKKHDDELKQDLEKIYAQLMGEDIPEAVQEQAAKVVRPVLKKKPGRTPQKPKPNRVNYTALIKEADRVRRLIELYEQQQDEEAAIMLLLVA